MLKISNTLTGTKEAFEPREPGKVKLYVCGVTPYDNAHMGHGRVYVTFDMLYRLLHYLDYEVTYCRNFTDIDDKLLNKAEAAFGDRLRYKEIADSYIKSYTEDMRKLNTLPPDYEPRVTENIDAIIAFIQGLIDKDKAYIANGDVYFHIQAFPDYGKLSKQKLDELRAGARVEVSELKKDPLDFALWKSESEGQFWKSPWGYGRPGWHIECSALAATYLGKHIDIHAGGMDLIFPHHENEIAQSEGRYGAPFSKYWMHNAFVRVDKEKMSKSLGNFFTLQDVFKNIDPMVIRYYYITHHYRAPLDFSFDDIAAVQKSYQRLCKLFSTSTIKSDKADSNKSLLVKKMLEFLTDDLNTPGMLGVVFEHLDELQKDAQELARVGFFLQDVIGLRLEPLPEKEVEITPEIQKLLDEREEARKAKNWARADEIRDQLTAMGFEVQDKKITK